MEPTTFTPSSALLGGALIGLAAVLLLAGAGRIAGIAGILSRLLPPESAADGLKRGAFVLGMLLAPAVTGLFGMSFARSLPAPSLTVAAAGLLVGFGSVLGSGCTSGHAICGLARLSPRSIVATLVFMGVAFVTVYVQRHLLAGAG